MTTILVREETWIGKDKFGNPLLSNGAKKEITHNGKYKIEFIKSLESEK